MNSALKRRIGILAALLLVMTFVAIPAVVRPTRELRPPRSREPLKLSAATPTYREAADAPTFPSPTETPVNGVDSPLPVGGDLPSTALVRSSGLFGRITHASDGLAAAGSHLILYGISGACVRAEDAVDSAGDYRFAGLPAGEYGFLIEPKGDRAALDLYVHLNDDTTAERDIVVPAGFTVVGKVTDAETGAAISEAQVMAWWSPNDSVWTSAEGEYVLAGLGSEDWYVVGVRIPGFSAMQLSVFAGEGETVRADFPLKRGRCAVGRIIDLTGRPIPCAEIMADTMDSIDPTGLAYDGEYSSSGPDGRFELRDLRCDLRYRLVVSATQFGKLTGDFPATDSPLAPIDVGDIVLRDAASIQGRVLDESGHGLAEVDVSVTDCQGGGLVSSGSDEGGATAGWPTRQPVVTDSAGRFAISDLAAGEYVVHASTDGRPEQSTDAISLANGELRDGVAFVFPTRLSIDGVVTDERGTPMRNARVSLIRDDGASPIPTASCTSCASGEFRCVGLEPGHYTVRADPDWADRDGARERWAPAFRCSVPAGTSDVRLSCQRSRSIKGIVLDAYGWASAHARVTAIQSDGNVVQWSISGPDGRFYIEVAEGTLVSLEARRHVGGKVVRTWPTVMRPGPAEVVVRDVAAGARDVLLSLPARH